jgi:hypothetical protein
MPIKASRIVFEPHYDLVFMARTHWAPSHVVHDHPVAKGNHDECTLGMAPVIVKNKLGYLFMDDLLR